MSNIEYSSNSTRESNEDDCGLEYLSKGMRRIEQFVFCVLEYTAKYNCNRSVSYAPENLIGKPSQYPNYGDFINTYMVKSHDHWWNKTEARQQNYMPQDVGDIVSEDYVVLSYEDAVLPTNIKIYETYNPGAVVRIWGRSSGCNWCLLWEGPPRKCKQEARIFEPPLKKINQLINELRIDFNQTLLDYYTSLDSVLLVGYTPESTLQKRIFLRRFESYFENNKNDCKTLSEIEYNYEEDQDLFSTLPYEVLIQIFKNLDLKSLCRSSQVSKRWYKVSKDPSLYYNLSLKRYWHKVDDGTLEYFMERCKNVKKLDLSWCGSDFRISEEKFLHFLQKYCKLTHLSVSYCKFIGTKSLSVIGWFQELTDLRLRNCPCSSNCFTNLANLKNLRSLDLYSTSINDEALVQILQSNNYLQHLIIDCCSQVKMLDQVTKTVSIYNRKLLSWSSWKCLPMTSEGVRNLSKCSLIRELDLGWCFALNDPGDCLEMVANGCKDLKRLIISSWRGVSDHHLFPIIRSCKQLTQLDLLGIQYITGDICELALVSLPKLQVLDVSFCGNIQKEQVKLWKIQYPHISIQASKESSSHWD